MTGTIELSEYVIDAIVNAVVKKMQEPCEDAISRTEVIKSIDEREDVNGKVDAESVRTDIVLMTSVKPQEPKTGHWIDDEYGSKCSCCGIYTHLDKFDRPMKFMYCSMCGAKMQEVEE